MQSKTCLLNCLFALLVSALPSGAQADTVQDILARIPAPLTSGRTIAMDLETESFVHRPQKDGSVDSRHIMATIWFMRDGDLVHSRRTSQVLDDNGNKRPGSFSTRTLLLTKEMAVDAEKYEGDSYFGLANVDAAELKKWAAEDHDTGCFLSGLLSQEMFVPKILEKDSKLRRDMEDINGSLCYVIEGTTGKEDVVAWVCPEKGWNLLKYVMHKSSENTLRGTPLKESEIADWTLTVDNIEIKKIGEEFLPVAGTMTHMTEFDDGRRSEIRTNVKATNIDLAPNFNAMSAFQLDIPDGTILNDAAGGLRYEVRGGKLVPYVDTSTVAALDEGVTAFLDKKESSTPVTSPAQPAVPVQQGQAGQQAAQPLIQRATFRLAALVMIAIGAAAIVLSVVYRRRKSSGTPT